MELKRIIDPIHPDAIALIALHKSTFPEYTHFYERALWPYLIENYSRLYFNAVYRDNQLVGMFSYWDIDDAYYLQFITIYPEFRNQKIGQGILDWSRTHLTKPLFIESEIPFDEITTRRLNFYKRNGFLELENDPEILSSFRDEDNHPLWFMGNESVPDSTIYIEKIRDLVYLAGDEFLA